VCLPGLDGRVHRPRRAGDGISVDLPFSQNIWIRQEGLNFPLLSDWDHDVIHRYDVVREDTYGMLEVAERSIFVLDSSGVVRYRWVEEVDSPDFEDVVDTVRGVVADLSGAGP
jgi:peroxiredoxin